MTKILRRSQDPNAPHTPFRDAARRLPEARQRDYPAMQVKSNRARSHGWWRNLVEYGAWSGPAGVRVGPPDREALTGIAKLFETTEERVAEMIAADWYGVHPSETSPAAKRLEPTLNKLGPADLDLLEEMGRRLAAQ